MSHLGPRTCCDLFANPMKQATHNEPAIIDFLFFKRQNRLVVMADETQVAVELVASKCLDDTVLLATHKIRPIEGAGAMAWWSINPTPGGGGGFLSGVVCVK